MVRVSLERHTLTATALVAWTGDLPRDLQQVLFDTADAGIYGYELAVIRHLMSACRPLRGVTAWRARPVAAPGRRAVLLSVPYGEAASLRGGWPSTPGVARRKTGRP